MQKIILYGTGNKAQILNSLLLQINISPQFCVDSDERKQGTIWKGYSVYSPGVLKENKGVFYIYIAATDLDDEIFHTLLQYNVERKRIKRFYEAVLWIIERKEEGITLKEKGSYTFLFDTINGYNAGGVEEWSKSIALHLKNLKDNVYLLGPSGDYVDNNELEKNTLDVSIDRTDKWSLDNICNIINKLKNYMPIVAITASQNITFYSLLYLKIKFPGLVKIISVVHNGTPVSYKEYADVHQFLDDLVCVSEDIVEGLEHNGIDKTKIYHMTCPVEVPSVFNRDYSCYEKPIKIGYAGRLEIGQKRLDLLPGILEELEKKHIDYCMEIAGNGSYYNELEKFIKRKKLANKVKLLGKIDRKYIPDFWQRQDICINISEHEGRCISTMEAMVNGAVPIVTRTSGVREDITNGENGYIVEIGDCAAIVELIQKLYQERHLLEIMGTRAYQEIAKKSSMDLHMNFWMKLLEKET